MVVNKRPIQQQINTDEQWEKLLQREELVVVDIYSEWCGPCTAMTPNLKKIKRRIEARNLHFVVAKSDTITHLEQFRNKSEPTWMFLMKGKIVNIMYGANAPKLIRLITEELEKEAAVKEGKRERVEVEITELPKDEEEGEIDSSNVLDQVSEAEKEEQIIISDEDFIYRPF